MATTTRIRWEDIRRETAPGGRPTYTFSAERDGDWWFVRSDSLERVFTQVRRLDQATEMARDVTALMLDVDPDSFNVHVVPKLEEPVRELVESARMARVKLELSQAEAAAVNAATAHRLAADGYSLRDIGAMMGVSFQRAGQLTKAPVPTLDLTEMQEAVVRAARGDSPELTQVDAKAQTIVNRNSASQGRPRRRRTGRVA